MSKCVYIILVISLSNSSFVFAQESIESFSTISFGINAVKDFHEGSFQKDWEPQLGIEGYFNTPFYLGTFYTGITYSAFGSKVNGAPDFRMFFFFIQWEYKVQLTRGINFALGGRTGLSEMRFEENDIVSDKNLLNETEFTAGIVARIGVEIASDWQFNLSANYIDIFTYPRMYSLYLGAGISKSFVTPDWLKDFLQ